MEEIINLDGYSKKILREIQLNGQITVQEISEKVGLSTTPCWRRVRELERTGVIRRYTVLVDREKVGLHTCVLAHVSLSSHNEDVVEKFEKVVHDCEEIVECYGTTGEADYVLKIIVTSLKAYDDFLHRTIFRVPGVSNIRSMVVLRDVKTDTQLHIE